MRRLSAATWSLILLLAALLLWAWAVRAEACGTATVVSIESVIDGDTFRADLQIWPHLVITETVRVLGVDTPERQDLDRWKAARDFTVAWLASDGIIIVVCKYDSFGRALGQVLSRAKGDLAAALIAAGHGVVYERRK